MAETTVARTFPLTPEELWSVLSDTPRMVRIDPALVAYEPEKGILEEGTLNRATSRIGPLRLTAVTRTARLRPPTQATFESVSPARPVRVRVEDTLEPTSGGTRYQVRIVAEPVGVIGRAVAPLIVRLMARSRVELFDRLAAELQEEPTDEL